MLVSFIFLLTVPLGTNYLRMCWTDLHQIVTIGSLHMDGHDQSDLLFAIAPVMLLW